MSWIVCGALILAALIVACLFEMAREQDWYAVRMFLQVIGIVAAVAALIAVAVWMIGYGAAQLGWVS